jgi:hypothetical protein
MAVVASVLDRAARAGRALRDDRRVAALLAELVDRGVAEADWRVLDMHRPRWSPVGVAVASVGPAGDPRLVLKLAHTDAGRAGLRREATVLRALREEPRLGPRIAVIPEPLDAFDAERDGAVAQTVVPGTPARAAGPVLAWIRALHGVTAARLRVDERHLRAWVDEPLATIGTNVGIPVDATAGRFRDGLGGRLLTTSWIHGDLWLGNVLVDRAGAVSGIVDWDRAAPDELPWHDVLHVLLAPDRLREPRSGRVVSDAARGRRAWTPDELEVLDAVRAELADESPRVEALVALYWLRHTAGTLAADPALGRDRGFIATHVRPLLDLDTTG